MLQSTCHMQSMSYLASPSQSIWSGLCTGVMKVLLKDSCPSGMDIEGLGRAWVPFEDAQAVVPVCRQGIDREILHHVEVHSQADERLHKSQRLQHDEQTGDPQHAIVNHSLGAISKFMKVYFRSDTEIRRGCQWHGGSCNTVSGH